VLLEWVAKPSIWTDILLETGVPKYIAKSCLYTFCFGGDVFTWVQEGYIDWEFAPILAEHPLYKALKAAGKKLRDKVEQQGGVHFSEDCFIPLHEGFDVKQAVAYHIQYIESMIISHVLDYVEENQNTITLIGVYHDGILCKINNRGRSVTKHLEEMNLLATEMGEAFGIKNVKLEVKI
jgi:hypothetical protein